ncbi:MAG: sigma-54 dependent transcriptional regulator [Kiritimatiellia bacterium]|jgi:DNA-binding NtrC family response regulator|nr:sigma-54 dependent transcriptional regulator [Kiritimatiellia bacterium]
MTPRILIVEDDVDHGQSLLEAVQGMEFEAEWASSGSEGLAAFRERGADVVLTDLVMPDIDGIEVMRRIRELDDGRTPVIVMTAYGSVDSSVRAMKEGAYDYLQKPLDIDDLEAKLGRALEAARLRRQVERLSAEVRGQWGARSWVVESPVMHEIVRQTVTLAQTHATVLIRGESGTGKELVARALHADGPRATGPFVAVNCAAFAESLLESELFGHEKGAFTGAVARRAGAFERAQGGTLFLDEIGDAPPAVQVKLLRVLEDRAIMRVGGQQSFTVDVRLVSATNRDLDAKVAAGTFRQDLLYRLQVVGITVPPLRDRREDIRPLAEHFIALAQQEHGRRIQEVEPAWYERLKAYAWPGNIRELRNVVEAAVVMTPDGVLRADRLQLGGLAAPAVAGGWSVPEGMTLDEMEKNILAEALRRNAGNRSLTAEQLGISRRTIQRKIQDYDLPF